MSHTTEILSMLNQGIPPKNIARQLGVTRQAVSFVKRRNEINSQIYYHPLPANSSFGCSITPNCPNKNRLKCFSIFPVEDNDYDNLFVACQPCLRRVTRIMFSRTHRMKSCRRCKQLLSGKPAARFKNKTYCDDCVDIVKKAHAEYQGLWSKKYKLSACRKCGSSESPPKRDGMCSKCDYAIHKKQILEHYRHWRSARKEVVNRQQRIRKRNNANSPFWSGGILKLLACRLCGSDKYPHEKKGVCTECYKNIL